ncbi:hypothetical protein NM208_g5417 [Fusarium decemcellulare]|uniref:Uncharacterized protein n=1 Tax=Fusarium decemcellulare TaxID=57161 RepID=A0ACC1SHC9_9HYPO|nr:hypothetical protein NM208_g5417 [Fusarium decemcellulare]
MDPLSPTARQPYEIFRDACQEFRDALTEKDKTLFNELPDATSMLKATHQHVESHPVHSSALTRCCRGINSLANRLSPYFDVANLFVSSQPEFAAIAWGSLGSNHVQFLEKVCAMFEMMSTLLPADEEYVSTLRSRLLSREHQRFNRIFRALAYIYADLIQFCFDMCKLFTRKRSKLLMLRTSFAYSTLWRPFDVGYDGLLQRWKQHREIFELEMSVSTTIQQLEASDRVEEMLRKFDGDGGNGTRTSYTKVLQQDDLPVRLKKWMDPPTWAHPLESSQHHRSTKTTEWFLEHPEVSRWLSQSSTDCAMSALSVQGKPGYGKTTLCATLVEYIQSNCLNQSSTDSAAVVYFFFDRQRRDNAEALGAFRAVLAQLLHTLRKDADILDIITLVWDQNRTGQTTASGNEILSALRLLDSRLSSLFMVMDGVDECYEYKELFDCIKQISRTFLRPRVWALSQDGVITLGENLEQLVILLATRASGMFLWARLLIEYLQSPYLSIRQRREAIEDLNRLQGLDSLYQEILRSLEQSSWQAARYNIIRAFQFVSYAPRPLHVDELRIAIMTPLSRSVDKEDIIPNFEKALAQMSGALIELDSDRQARFVHVSVLEYLTDPTREDQCLDLISKLVKERSLAERSCASCCIAYLLYYVLCLFPSRWQGVIPRRTMRSGFLTNLPLTFSEESELSLRLASDFLSAKRTIMTTTSWMLSMDDSNSLVYVEPMVACLNGAVKKLEKLSIELVELASSWGDVLIESPYEIWGPSISAFHKSSIWESVPGSEIVARFNTTASGGLRPICLKSHVTSDGKRLGILRLSTVSRQQRLENCLRRMVHRLFSKELNFEADIRLPNSSLGPFIQSIECIGEDEDQKVLVELPLAVTPDLSRIVSAGCAASIDQNFSSRTGEGQKQPGIQMLNFDFTQDPRGNMPFRLSLNQFKDTYALFVSNSREFIMTIHQSRGLVDLSENLSETWSSKLCLATVYQDETARRGSSPNYRYMTSLAFKPCDCGWATIEDFVILHPFLPLAAITQHGVVLKREPNGKQTTHVLRDIVLWTFSDTGNDALDNVQRQHTRLEFQGDGDFFYGKHLASHSHLQRSAMMRACDESSKTDNGAFDSQMVATSNSAVQGLNTTLSAVTSAGSQLLSSLEKVGAGSIVRQTLREDGLMVSKELTQLPRSLFSIADPTILPQGDRSSVRVVFNRTNRAFEPYEVYVGRPENSCGPSNIELPLVLMRQEETIPTYVGSGSYSFEEDQSSH